MSAERFTLDTNVLVYSVDSSAGPRHDVAVRIVERAALLGSCLTLQAVSEFFVTTTRKGMVSQVRAAEMAKAWLKLFPIVCASADAAASALDEVVAGRASYWDALLVATAAKAGCSAILTEDMADGTLLGGVRVVNPFTDLGLSEAADQLLQASP